jgi:hypothetical protein
VKLHGSVNWGRRLLFDPVPIFEEIDSDSSATGSPSTPSKWSTESSTRQPSLTWRRLSYASSQSFEKRWDMGMRAFYYPAVYLRSITA